MTKDRQQAGHWFGCHDFKNVICHGDPSNCNMPENRPLKFGATYWYYYKKNGNDDFYDPNESSTNSCPLLPGQTVNLMELPILRSTSFSLREVGDALTLNPQDRWTPLKRPEKPREVGLLRPSANDKSRDWWFNQSLGRLHTAIVTSVISGYSSAFSPPRLSCTEKRKRVVQVPGRRAKTSAGPADTAALECTADPVPKIEWPRQTSIRRPRLQWRPSDSFINPFQAKIVESPEPEIDYNHDDEDAEQPPSRPTTWSYTFPPDRFDSVRRPNSMPYPAFVGITSPSDSAMEWPQPVEATPKTSPGVLVGLPRIERLSLDALRLPSALQMPHVETDLSSLDTTSLNHFRKDVDSSALFASQTFESYGSYAESLPLSLGPESIRSNGETFSPVTNSPAASPTSSRPQDDEFPSNRLSLGTSSFDIFSAPSPLPPTRDPPPIPTAVEPSIKSGLTSTIHSSQETIKPTQDQTMNIPVPPIPSSPEFAPVSKPRSAGGRVRGMIASIERSKSDAGQAATGAQESGTGLKRTKSSKQRLIALGRSIL